MPVRWKSQAPARASGAIGTSLLAPTSPVSALRDSRKKCRSTAGAVVARGSGAGLPDPDSGGHQQQLFRHARSLEGSATPGSRFLGAEEVASKEHSGRSGKSQITI